MVEEALELVDVVVEHGHQATAAAGLKEGHLQMLEVVVALKPQFVLHGLGEVAPEQGVEVLEQGFGAPDQERHDGENGELAWHRGHTKARQPGSIALHHHIDR